MHDPRLDTLADLLIQHSTRLEIGEKILIETFDIPEDMVIALIRAARKAGGVPLVSYKRNRIQRELIQAGQQEAMQAIGECETHRMQSVQAYIGLRGSRNVAELSDVAASAMELYERHWVEPVHFKVRVPMTKWVVLRWPSASMAQQAKMSTDAFENFYFDVCTLNYSKMAEAQKPLATLLEQTDEVHITGPETDLRFSIKNIPAVPCSGEHNIPDGECFTAPVRDSVEGTIRFNTPTLYRGTAFENISLGFKDGRIVKASASDSQALNDILDTDEGARYIGEFAIGFNPFITTPMLDILFDEKIAGSFHFTPGQAYEVADNGNRSSVHWDMVMMQTPEFGGGEIYFDGELVRKDGRFVVPELLNLNPEQLK
jgi:aminopeptidase